MMNTMEKISIKVCGMRDHDNIMRVASLSPDYLGFIFYPHSPRFAGWDFIVPQELSPTVKRVGVFVNETSEEILRRANFAGFDHAQLHGSESVAQCAELKAAGLKVIKVFSVGEDFDFKVTNEYKQAVDFFLFDTKGKYYGGNAKTFDWNILSQYDQEVPFFLSGGLSPDNIEDVKQLIDMNLFALDLNSGVEVNPGLKDAGKIETILNAVTGLR